jgi:phage-related minor tail protein
MADERRVQLVAEVDTTGTQEGFNQIGQQADSMAQRVTQAGTQAAAAVTQVAQQATSTAQQVTQSGQQAAAAVTNVGAGGATAARNVETSQRSIIASIQRATVALQAGGRQTSQYYELMANQRGINPNVLAPYIAQLRAVEQAQQRTAASAGASAGQIANAMRLVPAQLSDVAVQLAGGQSPFLILLQQGSQLRDSFGSIPATLRGVATSITGMINPATLAAAAIGGIAYAYHVGSQEADVYNKAIIMSGNAAGASAGQLADYAASISQVVGTQLGAAAVLAELAGTGEVASENMREFGEVTVAAQKYIGVSTQDMAKNFADLGKTPVQSLLKLDEAYHFLTSSTLAQVKALEQQGKSDEAAEVAQKAYANAFASRAEQMKESLGSIERAWMGAKDSAALAWDMFLGVGRKKTTAQQLAEVREQIKLASVPVPVGGGDRGDAAAMRQAAAGSNLPELQRKERELQWQADKEAWDNQQAAISERLRKAGLEWDTIMDGTLSKAEQKKNAIQRVVNMGVAAGASQAQIDAAKRKVEQEYASLDNPAIAQAEARRAKQKEVLDGELQDVESQRKRLLLSESEYIEKKKAIQLQEIDLDIEGVRQKAAEDKKKEDQSSYQKDLGDLQVAMQRRVNIIKGASNAIEEVKSANKKAVDELVAGWDRQIAQETEGVTEELSLFGQSGQARQVAIAQMKMEADARKLIDQRRLANAAMSQQEIDDLKDQTKARQDLLGTLMYQRAAAEGAQQLLEENEKFGIEYIADARQRAMAELAIDAKKWQDLIQNAGDGTEAQKRLQQQYDIWYQNQLLKPQLDAQKKVWESVESTAHDTFVSIFDSGKSVFDRLTDTLKNGLLDLLYQMTVKQWIINIQATAGLSGLTTAAGEVGSAGSAAGGASSLVNGASAALNVYKGIGAGAINLAGGGIAAVGNAIGSTSLSAFGAGFAGNAAGTIGTAAESFAGAGMAAEASAASFGAAVSAALPWVAGAVAVASLWKSAFGHGETEVAAQGIRGTVSASSLSGQSYQNLHQDGGWFSSDRDWVKSADFTSEMVKQFTQGLSSLESASAGFAQSLGVSADWLKDYSKTFDLELTGDQTKDQQVIADFFTGVGDEIANKLVPNMSELSKSGESASAALERLAGDFKGTDQVAQLLGTSAENLFGSTGLASAKVREQLIDAAGGLTVLGQQATFYSQNFLTEAERIKPVSEALNKALGDLGLAAIPTTREQFKGLVADLISSGAAATAVGSKQLESLLALGEAFAQVHPDSSGERKGLQDQLDELTMTSTQLLAKQRDALDESNRALFDQVNVTKERKDLQDQLDDLTLSSTEKLQRQRDALDESNRALFDQVQALKAVKESATTLLGGVDSAFSVLQKVVTREKALLQERIDSETEAVTRLKSLTDSISSTLDNMSVSGSDAIGRQAAQAQIKAALASVQGGAQLSDDQIKNLGKAFSAVTQDSTKQFGSKEDYLFDMLTTRNDIAQLGDVTGDQLSAEEKSLEQLKDQSEALDNMLTKAQDQIDLLKGISTTGLSIEQALYGLQTSIVAAQQNSVVSATEAITKAYQDALGRNPDSAGMEFWQGQAAAGTSTADIVKAITNSSEGKQQTQIQQLYQSLLGRSADGAGLSFYMNSGASISDIAKAIKDSDEYKSLQGIRGYATGGTFAGGLRIVGENGPELEATGPSRIWSSSQTAELLSRASSPSGNNAALVEAVRDLKSENAQQRGVIERMAKDMAAMASILKGVSPNGTFIKTKA